MISHCAATLKDGCQVVVKVRRPGAVEQVEEDLAILSELAAMARRRWEIAELYDVVGLAEEFEQTLTAELDYVREGRNAERFARNFADHPDVHIPRVFWDTSTARVLTLERIHGVKIDDLAGLEAAGIDRHDLAERAARVVLKMVFEDGFFHADPHPGNFFIEPGGRIGLIDFGMVGSHPPAARRHQRRPRAPGRLFPRARGGTAASGPRQAERGFGPPAVSLPGAIAGRDAAGPDARGEPEDHAPSSPASSLHPGPAPEDGRHARVARHRAGSRLSNDRGPRPLRAANDVAGVLADRLGAPFGAVGLDAARLGADLPQLLRRLMSEVESGSLEVGMRPQGFEPILHRFERLANRIVLGILAAAFINGLAILMSVYHPPGWQGWQGWQGWIGTVFAVGFLLAAGLGAYVAWGIIRSR